MRVAIANRGEVAVRIIRACQEMGFKSILLHSTVDKNTPAYRLADEAIELKGNTPSETYLDVTKVLNACTQAKADMVHPGFGFLSENPDFAGLVEASKMIFVGPSSTSILLAGNKIKAKELAVRAGVPVIPAYTGDETDPRKLLQEAKKVGFPCMIKAASGGGGKGMKLVQDETEFIELLASAQREALNAFGSDRVFIEKFIQRPRHIEVQILFGAHGNGLHFFERDCSIQRRHQKIFEESPSLALTHELRQQITEAALKIAHEAMYKNAGTVEFLLDHQGNFYFMELNTRLQVEHTVTEMTCGVDFVHEQFKIAQKLPLTISQEQVLPRGHALEVRIYAENPAQQFLPSTGVIAELKLPVGPYRRFDFGYEAGDEITPYYDPMIGKVITWAPTRAENIRRMYNTLSELVIFGVHTNIEFLKTVLKSENFVTNNISTDFLQEEFAGEYQPPPLSPAQIAYAQEAAKEVGLGSPSSPKSGLRYQSPWIL